MIAFVQEIMNINNGKILYNVQNLSHLAFNFETNTQKAGSKQLILFYLILSGSDLKTMVL